MADGIVLKVPYVPFGLVPGSIEMVTIRTDDGTPGAVNLIFVTPDGRAQGYVIPAVMAVEMGGKLRERAMEAMSGIIVPKGGFNGQP